MKVYILEIPGRSREQIWRWLSEDKEVNEIVIFEDYIRFIEQVGELPPDFCFIRVGHDGIPGLKSADMVRQISPDSSIVFIADDSDYAVDAHEVGVDGYLLCPLKRDKLEKCLLKKRGFRL